jgi:hypothetical protein
MNLLGLHERVLKINEPAIGQHLSPLMPDLFELPAASFDLDQFSVPEARADDPNYFFCSRYEAAWNPELRRLILARLHAQVQEMRKVEDPLVALKEPNGSQGAELIMGALPESRMIFLVRDGRDVVDSELDAQAPGSWLEAHRRGMEMSTADRLRFVEERGLRWSYRMHVVLRAYERHAPERRFMLRYEDLRQDSEGWIARMFDWLGLEIDPERLANEVRATSFEAVPPEAKGAGKFVRAAQPGLWRESLSAEEQEVAERTMGDTLRRLGYSS